MSFALDREKELPAVPVDIDASGNETEDSGLWTVPSLLPSINVENTLLEEEIVRLHELWNGAGLSARAHRRRRRDQTFAPRRIPAPISIPDPEIMPPTLVVPSSDSCVTGTSPTSGIRKRWRFPRARPFSETHGMEKKAPNTLEKLRAIAQDRLKKKLRYAKSAPNLGDQATVLGRGPVSQRAMPVSTQPAPRHRDKGVSEQHNPPSPGNSAAPEVVPQQEDMDENAIYFTIDPNWRASQGSVQFESITPIPDGLIVLGRPDSPLLHRHHSLDQLSFVALQATRSSTAMESPVVHPRREGLHLIDELHAHLEF